MKIHVREMKVDWLRLKVNLRARRYSFVLNVTGIRDNVPRVQLR